MPAVAIREGGLGDPQVEALLRLHHAEAHESTPAGNAHALDAVGLAASDITFFTAWAGDALAGMAALRTLDATHAEVKSMRTHPDHLRRGVAATLLAHLVSVAKARGITRLSLETGTAPMFAAANRLYEREGFTDCDAFGGYPSSSHNRFMMIAM